MSISLTQNTSIKFHPKSDEITQAIGPYAKKLRVSLTFDPDLDVTDQSQAPECDINNIMARYMKTGLFDFVSQHQPQYGDFTGLEFGQMQDQIVQAKNMFADLPAKLRDRFSNDPAKFLDFFNDPGNALEAAKMGLLAPEKAQAILNPTPDPKTSLEPSKQPEPSGDKKAD